MTLLRLIAAAVTVGLLTSACSTISVTDYADNLPQFSPEKFFDGPLTAHGIVKNRSGKVIRYFNADISASWKNGVGVLEEKFLFNDGEVQYRTWMLTPAKQDSSDLVSRYTATAGDVIGTGHGQVAGNAFNLHYVLAVKRDSGKINVDVNDWMWLVDENTILNESTLTKFGLKVGSIQVTISKSRKAF